MSTPGPNPYSAPERRAVAPAVRLTVSAWAETHRLINSKDAAEPGPWRNERAPYLCAIMDALGDRTTTMVILRKPARVGGSEALRNALCSWIDQDPGPCLLVYPDEKSTKEQLADEITPMITGNPRLADSLTGLPRDLSKEAIELRTMRIYLGWAGSAQSLASRTIRYVILDEIDKYPPFSGREADPISLAKRRVQTYDHRAKVAIISTPTTRHGAISRAFDACEDRRLFHVPCPHCGVMQALTWAQVRWPKQEGEQISKRALADRVEREKSAWVECSACKGRIDEHEKAKIEAHGEWRSESGAKPPETSNAIAFQLSGLYSMLGLTWHKMAAQYLRAVASSEEGDIGPLMEFVTQSLGEPFEDQVRKVSSDAFERKRAAGHRPREVPKWSGRLIATADSQKGFFVYVVRAWGRGERSRLIDRGRAESFKDLRAKTLDARYPIDGWAAEFMSPDILVIDSGGGTAAGDADIDRSRTDEVYRFAKTQPNRIIPVKGWGGTTKIASPIVVRQVEYKPPGAERAPFAVTLHMLDTGYFKDNLASLIQGEAGPDGIDPWELCDDVDDDYVREMTGEHKVAIRKAGAVQLVWQKRSAGRAVDLWDCEVYQLAASRILRADVLPDEFALEQSRIQRKPARVAPVGDQQRRPTMPDGRPFFINRRDR